MLVNKDTPPKSSMIVPDYIPPKIVCPIVAAHSDIPAETWTTYRYPTGQREANVPGILTVSAGEDGYCQELNASSRKRKFNTYCDQLHGETDRPSKRIRTSAAEDKQHRLLSPLLAKEISERDVVPPSTKGEDWCSAYDECNHSYGYGGDVSQEKRIACVDGDLSESRESVRDECNVRTAPQE